MTQPKIGEITFNDEVIDAAVDDTTEVVAKTEVYPDPVSFDDDDLLTEEQIIDKYYPLPEDFPSKEELVDLESKYGKIRIHRMAPYEAYVVKALSRSEMKKYIAELRRRFPEGTKATNSEIQMVQEEMLVEACLLWPKVNVEDIRGESFPVNKIGVAGTVSVLAYDINEISNLVETNVGPFEEV